LIRVDWLAVDVWMVRVPGEYGAGDGQNYDSQQYD